MATTFVNEFERENSMNRTCRIQEIDALQHLSKYPALTINPSCTIKIDCDMDYARFLNLVEHVEHFRYISTFTTININRPIFNNGTYCLAHFVRNDVDYNDVFVSTEIIGSITVCDTTEIEILDNEDKRPSPVGVITLDEADPILVEGSARMLLGLIETVDRLQNFVENNEDFQSLREFVDIPWENDDECGMTVNKDLRNLLANKIQSLMEYISNV